MASILLVMVVRELKGFPPKLKDFGGFLSLAKTENIKQASTGPKRSCRSSCFMLTGSSSKDDHGQLQ